jgi:hypothetical protein
MEPEGSMAKPAYRKAFDDFVAKSPDFSHSAGMEEEHYLGSDRTAVILQASNLERLLELLLQAKMRRPLARDVQERIFEGNGPLSTFSNKILIGYALELYGPVFKHDLEIIKDLRNGFAHVRLPLELTQPELAGMCAQLNMAYHPIMNAIPQVYSARYEPLEVAADDDHPRTRFTRACFSMSICLLDLGQFWTGLGGVERQLP